MDQIIHNSNGCNVDVINATIIYLHPVWSRLIPTNSFSAVSMQGVPCRSEIITSSVLDILNYLPVMQDEPIWISKYSIFQSIFDLNWSNKINRHHHHSYDHDPNFMQSIFCRSEIIILRLLEILNCLEQDEPI